MSLEKKRKTLELSRVTLAKQEIEFRIEEMQEEILRLKSHVQIQDEKIKQLNTDIKSEGVTNG